MDFDSICMSNLLTYLLVKWERVALIALENRAKATVVDSGEAHVRVQMTEQFSAFLFFSASDDNFQFRRQHSWTFVVNSSILSRGFDKVTRANQVRAPRCPVFLLREIEDDLLIFKGGSDVTGVFVLQGKLL